MQLTGSDRWVTTLLRDRDLYCKTPLFQGEHYFDDNLVLILHEMAERYGEVVVTSSYRTAAANLAAGGAANSQHLYGKAVDVRPVSKFEFERMMADLVQGGSFYQFCWARGMRGLGLYRNWVHIDVREGDELATWDLAGGQWGEGYAETTQGVDDTVNDVVDGFGGWTLLGVLGIGLLVWKYVLR